MHTLACTIVSAVVVVITTCTPKIPDTSIEFPLPSDKPSVYQMQQIERKYGMFIHFGINSFHDLDWTDGSKPASSYAPTAIDAAQWVETAKKAGMKYIILVSKHHEGFCLWDSQYTEYDVANSSNPTNVVEAVARECKKQGIQLGLYYSMWDRTQNPDTANPDLDEDYNRYMIDQLNELMDITSKYTRIVEMWFDGEWEKQTYRWPIAEIYKTIKSREPQCQVGINWTIGRPDSPDDIEWKPNFIMPEDQKEGDPIRYFPSDFRLGDPYFPRDPDPKLFSHNGKLYYMPWETTILLGQRWFYYTEDKEFKSVEELYDMYIRATAQDNIFIINASPNRDGVIGQPTVDLLIELRKKIENE